MYYSVDERLLAKIRLLHIQPAKVIKGALSREVTRRSRARSQRVKRLRRKQIVNRFSGEILSTK